MNVRASDTWMTPVRRLGRIARPLLIRGFPRRFGLFEVLALGSVEWMRRHLAIVNVLETTRRNTASGRLTVLDFGGAGGTLGRALHLYGLADGYEVTVVDVDRDAIEATPVRPPVRRAIAVEAEGTLPFPDDAFDVVVSSDVFEHIPEPFRRHWADELARVARLGQVHTVPCDSDDGRWRSTDTDRAFAEWHEARFEAPERWTSEHLTNGVPSDAELRRLFPSASLEPIVNGQVWLVAMQRRFGPRGPIARLRFALAYYRRMRRIESSPPFKNCLVVTGGLTGRPPA